MEFSEERWAEFEKTGLVYRIAILTVTAIGIAIGFISIII